MNRVPIETENEVRNEVGEGDLMPQLENSALDEQESELNFDNLEPSKEHQDLGGSESLCPQQETCDPQSNPVDCSQTIEEERVDEQIKLATEWLQETVNDISLLGSIVTEQAVRFGEKKISVDVLSSYDDVLNVLSKVKLLIKGVHENYKEIENSLDTNLKTWKFKRGLEEPVENDSLTKNGSEENHQVEEVPKLEDDVGVLPNVSDENVKENENEPSKTIPEELEKDNTLEQLEMCDVTYGPEENNKENNEKEVEHSRGNKDGIDDSSDKVLSVQSKNEDSAIETKLVDLSQKELTNDVSSLNQDNEPKSESIERNSLIEGSVIPSTEINKDSSNHDEQPCNSSNDDLSESVISKGDSKVKNSLQTFLSIAEELCGDEKESCGEKDPKEDSVDNDKQSHDGTSKDDPQNFEALQELLCSSSDDETISTGSSDSSDSSEISLDDSDLDIKKIVKTFPKKSLAIKKKEKKTRDDSIKIKGENNKIKEESNVIKDEMEQIQNKENVAPKKNEEEDKDNSVEEESKKSENKEEELDSEAEIDMLTDLTKLKKKNRGRKGVPKDYSEEDNSEDESDDSNESDGDKKESSRKGKKYNNLWRKRKEEERNELFGFLEGNTSNEDEADITKHDLDVIEDGYVSSGNESMSLEKFSKKMNEKWREIEKQQEEMNLQLLLASDSEGGSVGGEDMVLESDSEKKKKKQKDLKEVKEEAPEEEKVDDKKEVEGEVEVKEEENKDDKETEDVKIKDERDDEYEQFLEGMVKSKTEFKGLGSSSEEDNVDSSDEIDIKEEDLSDAVKVKKEKKDSDGGSSSNSESSLDLLLDIGKKKSLKSKSWRTHKLLRIKLSDTDTSDEERWWKRRLEKEQKKKEGNSDDSDTSGFKEFNEGLKRLNKSSTLRKKKDKSSDKENKKVTNEEKDDGSSTMELSSTESSGSSVFKKKKKKKASSSDSDIIFVSEDDKKKKKKKKRGLGVSSEDSSGSGNDVMDITQKSTQGESPGKGGRKNIRKVLTKHELAAATKAAAKEEDERKKRIAARQKLYNEMFEIKEAEVLEKLVLDFDPDTKTELIAVDKDLVTKMKPHQAKGVKFMWDSCFESISQLQTKKGSGCILAHCMGLGKTFQVVSLVHTILKHADTRVRTVLVVCPLSTVLNWASEFRKWLDDIKGGKDIKTYNLASCKRPHERSMKLTEWHQKGGVMILGYEMFRTLTNEKSKNIRFAHRVNFQKTLIDPGADLVVCDEGHMLKNESTILSKAMSRIKTLRRIVLTGTPMQNNLKEYHCMVQFVKPNLLGTRKEFLNQFVNPITNGQFVDSTESDVKVMKRRAHVLHKMLEGLVQRFDYSVLTPFLPPKHEYVISLRLSDKQVRLYQFYLDNFSNQAPGTRTGSQLFQDWQALARIWTHPRVLKMYLDKVEKEREKERLEESEEEEPIKDVSNDKSSSSEINLSSSHSSSLSSSLSSDEDDEKKKKREDKKKEKEEKKKQREEKKLKIEEKKKRREERKNKESGTNTISADVPDEIEAEINLISSEEEQDITIKQVEEKINECEETPTEGEAKCNTDSSVVEIEPSEATVVEIKSDQPSQDDSKAENDNKENPDQETEKVSKDEETTKLMAAEEASKKSEEETKPKLDNKSGWWKSLIDERDLDDINQSAKLILLFAILRESEMIEDKVLVFSQSLFSLNLIEYFLEKVDKATKENSLDESVGNHAGLWTKGKDYFRLDGSCSLENRNQWCKAFNKEGNPRARLFLISTRAGGLGINLTAANRVVIFDASWNPSHDIQSIFRIYRFGQKKPCYVYRFIAAGTMEEKVYERQVAKQSLSSRVVDEQQVHRHFSMSDLNELYRFTPPTPKEDQPTPVLPKDRLMAEIITQHNEWIEKFHEHDSLLENVVEEELNEEERKLAWEDYENEKKKGNLPIAPGATNFNPDIFKQAELFRKSLQVKFPNASETELNDMLQTLMVQFYKNSQQVARQMQTPQNQAQTQGTSIFQPNSTGAASLTPQQRFNYYRSMLYKKYGENSKQGTQNPSSQASLPQNVQATTSGLNSQQRPNQQYNQDYQKFVQQQKQQNQRIGNSQIRKQNQSLLNAQQPKTYEDQMRMQQEMNLARIRNQQELRRKMANTMLRGNANRLGNTQQNVQRNTQQNISGNTQQNVPRNTQLSSQTQRNSAYQQPTNTAVIRRAAQSRVRDGQSRYPVNNTGRPANGSSVQPVAIVQSTTTTTPQQLAQEAMKKRIRMLQHEKQLRLQQRMRQRSLQANSNLPDHQRRQLEEMKNRYKASRNNQPPEISIVEIDG